MRAAAVTLTSPGRFDDQTNTAAIVPAACMPTSNHSEKKIVTNATIEPWRIRVSFSLGWRTSDLRHIVKASRTKLIAVSSATTQR
jgi:hypothetical protein